jgi:hypothetical protein
LSPRITSGVELGPELLPLEEPLEDPLLLPLEELLEDPLLLPLEEPLEDPVLLPLEDPLLLPLEASMPASPAATSRAVIRRGVRRVVEGCEPPL